MAQYLKIHPENPQQRLIDIAVTALQRGELVIYPTDTTYAIACQLGDKGVLQRLISLRRLDSGHQFTLACKDLSELGSYARVENSVYRLLKRNTPGPFYLPSSLTKSGSSSNCCARWRNSACSAFTLSISGCLQSTQPMPAERHPSDAHCKTASSA